MGFVGKAVGTPFLIGCSLRSGRNLLPDWKLHTGFAIKRL